MSIFMCDTAILTSVKSCVSQKHLLNVCCIVKLQADIRWRNTCIQCRPPGRNIVNLYLTGCVHMFSSWVQLFGSKQGTLLHLRVSTDGWQELIRFPVGLNFLKLLCGRAIFSSGRSGLISIKYTAYYGCEIPLVSSQCARYCVVVVACDTMWISCFHSHGWDGATEQSWEWDYTC